MKTEQAEKLGQRLLRHYAVRDIETMRHAIEYVERAVAKRELPEPWVYELAGQKYTVPATLVEKLDALPCPHYACFSEWYEIEYNEERDAAESWLVGDDAPRWLHKEVEAHAPVLVEQYTGGEGFLWLYRHPTRDDVLYLRETDGESGTHLAMRFGPR